MNIIDLDKVSRLEKNLKKLRNIKELIAQGFIPHFGVKNSHREDVNFFLPESVALEVINSQEQIILKLLHDLDVQVE